MRIISFNVNGVRARFDSLNNLLVQHKPAIVGLQETKVEDDLFPVDWFTERGYQSYFFGQKGHYGVAFLVDTAQLASSNIEVTKGFGGAKDDQKRFIGIKVETRIGSLSIYNGYFPQGENSGHPTKFVDKEKFYNHLLHYLLVNHAPQESVIVMGDFNVAYQDNDIGIGEPNQKRWLKEGKCCFLPIERDWYKHLVNWGLIDTYRSLNPDTEHYSWFDYRSGGFNKTPKRGLRIDYILATSSVLKHCQQADILSNFRDQPKPSDHCPITISI